MKHSSGKFGELHVLYKVSINRCVAEAERRKGREYKSLQNQVLADARFNTEYTIFQLYSKHGHVSIILLIVISTLQELLTIIFITLSDVHKIKTVIILISIKQGLNF